MNTNHRYAGFWIRFLAAILDGIIIGAIGSMLFPPQIDKTFHFAPGQGLAGAIYIIAFWLWLSTTPGKMALGLKVIQENGQNLDAKAAILRYLSYFISFGVILLGVIWIGFDAKKQGWHDKIAKTYVIHTK